MPDSKALELHASFAMVSTRIPLYLFVGALLSLPLQAVPACHGPLGELADKGKLDELVDTYLDIAEEEPAKEASYGDGGSYLDRTVGLREGRSSHTLEPDSLLPDIVFALDLPTNPAASPWARLPSTLRPTLVRELANRLRLGEYDHEVASGDNRESEDMEEVGADEPATALDAINYEGGFSPGKFIAGALQGKRSGICRHGSCALAGAMAELGAPGDAFRIVVGGQTQYGQVPHAWSEVAFNNKWVEYDPTPGLPTLQDPEMESLMMDLAGIAQRQSLRQQFPFLWAVFPGADFLRPLNVEEFQYF